MKINNINYLQVVFSNKFYDAKGIFFTRLKHCAFGCSLLGVLSWDLRHQSVFLI